MAWVTWRQNRIQFIAGGAVLLAVALLALGTGQGIRSAYEQQDLAACCPR